MFGQGCLGSICTVALVCGCEVGMVGAGPMPDKHMPTVLASTRLTEVRGFSDFCSEFFQVSHTLQPQCSWQLHSMSNQAPLLDLSAPCLHVQGRNASAACSLCYDDHMQGTLAV